MRCADVLARANVSASKIQFNTPNLPLFQAIDNGPSQRASELSQQGLVAASCGGSGNCSSGSLARARSRTHNDELNGARTGRKREESGLSSFSCPFVTATAALTHIVQAQMDQNDFLVSAPQ